MDGDFLLIELRATPSEWPLIVGDGKTREHEKMKDGARSAPVADLESRRKLSVRRYNWAGRDLKLPNCRCPLGNPSRDRWREIPKSRISVRCEAGLEFAGRPFRASLSLKTRSRSKTKGGCRGQHIRRFAFDLLRLFAA